MSCAEHRGMRSFLISLLIATPLVSVTACKKSADAPPAADNTAQNKRENLKTADQAAQGGSDLDLTAKIRRGIMDADGLSTNAQNAKIVVDKGVVTLAGPVATDAERTKLISIATSAGATSVVNQLEISN